ncbi:MAG: ABC transporter permease [Desulfobulbaceae bacterium]|nr:ABC transporter permease [Desulfobulbaceae bacterium]
MQSEDIFRFSGKAIISYRFRTVLMLIAMAIGVASVVVLISLGESARRYVSDQFASLGTNLLIVLPGRSETVGGPPPLLGATPRDLTLDDATALLRAGGVAHVSPIVVGSAPVSYRHLEREVMVIGATADLAPMRNLETVQGRFLPPGDPGRGSNVCVLGSKLKTELFANTNPLGQWVRIGDHRFRIIGVLAPMGVSLGDDIDETITIPVATAQTLFNTASLFRILIEATDGNAIARAKKNIRSTISQRHEGEDDITVITQDAILATFDRIFRVLTAAVAGIAAISLLVAGIMIMNVMLVAVSNRRTEVGLLKALGAPQRQIMRIFLAESALLSLAGALLGLLVALIGLKTTGVLLPEFPIQQVPWASMLAAAVALVTGLLFGILPASRAAKLPPTEALAKR